MAAPPGDNLLRVDPKPRFSLSRYLFMQFMEPLGTTDGSVEAGWDFERNRWRDDLVHAARELAPTLIRRGGCLSSYYRWKEGVGPTDRRKPMINLCWGGTESNRVGTAEFVDFCRQVSADPLIAVNFESDGRRHWARPGCGGIRSAGPDEAAEWVDYCNNPDSELRESHGIPEPLDVRIWQIGNETSYEPDGFDCRTAARKTLEFARAMRKADPGIELIGWGDSGWARVMLETAGDELQYLAFHHHFDSGLARSPLKDPDFRRDPGLTWRHLMNACRSTERAIRGMREQVAGSRVRLALTESHFALPGRNRCDVLATWAAAVADARILNVHARNGDLLKIATLADFFGTRWMVNAIMIPTPHGRSYLMPVAHVMALYRKHTGDKAVDVSAAPSDLDVTASRTGDRIFLHVVNVNRTRSVKVKLAIDGMTIRSGRIFQIAADPEFEVTGPTDALKPAVRNLPADHAWAFPAASVSAVELDAAAMPAPVAPPALSG